MLNSHQHRFDDQQPNGLLYVFALMAVLFSIALAPAMATIQDLVLLRMTATAIFMLGQSVVGRALGPFIAG